MNEQLAIKRSMQLMSLFGSTTSSKDLLNMEPNVRDFFVCTLPPLNKTTPSFVDLKISRRCI